jgi:carnitine 3-dehydrogenase
MSGPEPNEFHRVAVIGTGTIGASWASYFLARGMSVAATDPAPNAEERLFAYIHCAWPVLEELGLVVADADINRLVFEPSVREAVRAAEFVQENGPEIESAKTDLIAEIDAACPSDTVIASSTLALPMTPLQSKCRHPERCVLAHPFNPPHLIPLVELSGGRETDPGVLDWAVAFYEGIGRSPVRLEREIFGHIANRLQYVVWNEAVRLVLDGVSSVADVERAMSDGPGLR